MDMPILSILTSIFYLTKSEYVYAKMLLEQDGFLDCIFNWLFCKNQAISFMGMKIIGHFIFHPFDKLNQVFYKEGVYTFLIEWTTSEQEEIVKEALWTLSNVVVCEENLSYLMENEWVLSNLIDTLNRWEIPVKNETISWLIRMILTDPKYSESYNEKKKYILKELLKFDILSLLNNEIDSYKYSQIYIWGIIELLSEIFSFDNDDTYKKTFEDIGGVDKIWEFLDEINEVTLRTVEKFLKQVRISKWLNNIIVLQYWCKTRIW